jgi:hypothetical protein
MAIDVQVVTADGDGHRYGGVEQEQERAFRPGS